MIRKIFKKNFIRIKNNYLIILILIIGLCLRFYNLNWDKEFILHPDEEKGILKPTIELLEKGGIKTLWYGPLNFITTSISYFFVYAFQFIYLKSANFLPKNIIIAGRINSALFSTLSLLISYKILSFIIKNKYLKLTTTFLLVINIGLIQNAHFATPESLLIFSYLLFCFFVFDYFINKKQKIFLKVCLGLVMAILTKLNGLFLIFPFNLLSIYIYKNNLNKINPYIKNNSKKLKKFLPLFLLPLFLILYLISWQQFFDQFLKLFRGVFLGKNVLIFSLQFVNKPFLIFALKNILPYIISPITSVILVFSTIYCFLFLLKKVKKTKKEVLIFWLCFFVMFYFLLISIQFVKFARYYVPLIPFFFIIFGFFLENIKNKVFKVLLLALVIAESFLFSFKFIKIYFQKDTRLQASNWTCQNIKDKKVLLEMHDYNTKVFYCIRDFTYFDMFNLTKNNVDEFLSSAAKHDYIIIASEKNYRNIMALPENFPAQNKYYQSLFNGNLGFKLEKVFRLNFPDDMAEETFRVLDHPKIMIFKNEGLNEN